MSIEHHQQTRDDRGVRVVDQKSNARVPNDVVMTSFKFWQVPAAPHRSQNGKMLELKINMVVAAAPMLTVAHSRTAGVLAIAPSIFAQRICFLDR